MRKLKLFAASCFRHVIHLLPDPNQHRAIDALETIGEGQVEKTSRMIVAGARLAIPEMSVPNVEAIPIDDPHFIALMLYREHCSRSDAHHAAYSSEGTSNPEATQKWQRMILRDIFGNPFRPTVADPEWLSPTVQSIAASIYKGRAFDRLPVLADAFEEAGCTNADVLLHCRKPAEHVRGCWVVDLVLGKQ
jgi:hypothetical protein